MYARYAELRDAKGVRDADVSSATGIKKSTLSDWKAGISEPKFDKLIKIADFFGVSIEVFANAKREEA